MKMDIQFSKKQDMKYISHLDLMRLFQRSARRAGIPVTLTQGFSPHFKISIKRALKLGLESDNEEASFYLEKSMNPREFQERINRQLPEGIHVFNAEVI